MENFEFKSAICTSVEQSKRLLELGLKKETADMCLQSTLNDVWSPYIPIAMLYSKVEAIDLSKDVFRIIPAWSLHRLIAMVADTPLQVGSQVGIHVEDTYDTVIQGIEWLISRGQFNKDYLEEKK